ncbi:hypothetical protein [Solirubrobacter soli]|uniref:hypothetical protein n=1 Tax=Solirubrobacter soli TaxID=363832 RepID=UPI000419272F|nr:hypothetical protein [Solirubrobacter soli]
MPTLSPPRSAWLAVLSLLALLCLLPTGASAATEARATPAETAQLLFVAGDVRRLDRAPSGTVDTVLEQILQQLYRDDPALEPADAQREIGALRAALNGGDRATSPATLQALPGNQRVLAILAAFQRSRPSARVGHALARVADRALTEASTSTLATPSSRFNAAADSFSTLLYGSFSPAATLRATAQLAAGNDRFGRARDGLWAAASHESVFDSTAALLAANPALRTDAVRALTAHLTPDGGLTANVAELEALIRTGLRDLGRQTTDAMDQHRAVVAACPGVDCQTTRDHAQADGAAARTDIAAQRAALAATSGLLAQADTDYGAAIAAEAQAAAQVAGAVNSYYAATDYGEYIHIAGDVVGLGLSLAESVVNPAAAVTGVITVVGDIVGQTVTGPDANALILQGLQGVSQQLSAFATATSAQFAAVDARLEGLNRQVGLLAGQLSTQLAQARAQLTGISDALASLQTSVDRLGDELRRLFADQAQNRLKTLVNQSLRYQAFNPARPTTQQFSGAADELMTDSVQISFSETILQMPGAFDALAASGLSQFDPAINFFALFPARVTDSTAPKLPALGTNLPDPDFWAASSRAYAQLLLENRDYVTAARLTELDAMLGAGDLVTGALANLTKPDTGSGTGNTVYNAALNYYASWADGVRAGAPTLTQAIRAEREDYLKPLKPGGIVANGPWIDPWGGASQPLRGVNLLGLGSLSNIQSENGGRFVLPDLQPAPALVENLPAPVVNALRLGIGSVAFTWDAFFTGGVAPQRRGQLVVDFYPIYHGRDGRQYGLDRISATIEGAINCAGIGDALDAERTVQSAWSHPNADNCPAVAAAVNLVARERSATAASQRALDYVTPLVEHELETLRTGVYDDLLSDNGNLTQGAGVADAARRLEGAERLLDGYVTLGLPQALATDDRLRSLVAGEDANPLAHPFSDARTTAPADDVPGQVASFFHYVAEADPASDPLGTLSVLLNRRRVALQDAIAPYIERGRANGQDPADGGGLSQANPLVSSTLDRLVLTKAVLADDIARRGSGGTGDPTPQPQPTPTPAPATPAPATPTTTPTQTPAVATRVQLVRAPRARGRAITFTLRCVSGTCRPAATLSAGRRTVGRARAFSLAPGATRTVTVRLDARGRRLLARRHRLSVTVRITTGNALVATRRVTVR